MSKKYTSENIEAVSAGRHIRLRPELYFEDCFKEKNLDALPVEVLCHAFDEYFGGRCNEVKLTVRKTSFSIVYNAGMLLSDVAGYKLSYAEIIMTKIGACSNLKKHLAVGEEFCRVGMATINLASETCQLTTVGKNKKGTFAFEHGETKTRLIAPFKSEKSWTEIHVTPNKELFKNLQFTSKGIQARVQKIKAQLPKLNLLLNDKIESA